MIPGMHLPDGLSLRPAGPGDSGFIESLYHSTRDDLRLLDAEPDFIETLIESQFQAQTEGYGESYPNAWHFIIEKQKERIGRLILDFETDGVRIVNLAFIQIARGRGYGSHILRGLQQAAIATCAPLLLTVSMDNPGAKRLYTQLGFITERTFSVYEQLVWYPPAVG
jgi:ribosomal protein S18 acetylase RimI-like enzyme